MDWNVAKVRSNMEASSQTVITVFLHSNCSHIIGLLGFFGVGVVLIRGQFPLFQGLYDSIDLANLKGIVPIHSIDEWFDLVSGFLSPGECGD